jgi:hypothetical protein
MTGIKISYTHNFRRTARVFLPFACKWGQYLQHKRLPNGKGAPMIHGRTTSQLQYQQSALNVQRWIKDASQLVRIGFPLIPQFWTQIQEMSTKAFASTYLPGTTLNITKLPIYFAYTGRCAICLLNYHIG